jgi:hypothetical protein
MTAPLLVAGLTVVAVLSFSLIQLMLGVSAQLSALIFRDTLLKALYNFLLTVPIYAGLRRALRPALIDDIARRPFRFRRSGRRNRKPQPPATQPAAGNRQLAAGVE